jgi:hypothetical protein
MDYNTFEKLIVTQIIKKFSAIYGARDFITLFVKIGHFFPSLIQQIKSGKIKEFCLF